MINRAKLIVPALIMISIFLFSSYAFAASASDDLKTVCASNPSNALCAGYSKGEAAKSGDNALLDTIGKIIDIMSYIAGILAVIMVIYGGILYVTGAGETGAGEPQKAANGRQTIIYSLIGAVVVVVSAQLVLFVLDRLFK